MIINVYICKQTIKNILRKRVNKVEKGEGVRSRSELDVLQPQVIWIKDDMLQCVDNVSMIDVIHLTRESVNKPQTTTVYGNKAYKMTP